MYRLSRAFFYIWFKALHSLTVFGRENFPKKGPFICAPNHVSFGDPPAVGVACGRIPLIFMAKKELFENKRWGWWFKASCCIPITRLKNDYRATRQAIKRLKEGKAIAIFPQGTRSSSDDLQEAEFGVAFLAEKSGAPVIPVYIEGTQKVLPKDSRYTPGAPVSLYIGKAVDFHGAGEIEHKRERYAFMAKRIMREIAELKKSASMKKQTENRVMQSIKSE